jgi:hypothetical protein
MNRGKQQRDPPWSVAIDSLIGLDALERLCGIGSEALSKELDELHRAMDRDYETLNSSNEEDTYLRHVNDEYIEASETLPRLHWYAQFLVVYSFFERALNALSESLASKAGTSLVLKDMAGQGVHRAQRYLSKACCVNGPFESPNWQRVLLLSELRNAIAHRSGCIDNLPNDRTSLYCRLQDAGVELRTDLQDQKEAQIFFDGSFVLGSIKIYREMLCIAGGLGTDFTTPKHGKPSGSGTNTDW